MRDDSDSSRRPGGGRGDGADEASFTSNPPAPISLPGTLRFQLSQRFTLIARCPDQADKTARQQAVEHNIECIEIGQKLSSNALTVWVGDGTNFPGQQDLGRSLDRYLDAAAQVYPALPGDWRMLLEHKMFEPAFYSTVISDWDSSILAAQTLGG